MKNTRSKYLAAQRELTMLRAFATASPHEQAEMQRDLAEEVVALAKRLGIRPKRPAAQAEQNTQSGPPLTPAKARERIQHLRNDLELD